MSDCLYPTVHEVLECLNGSTVASKLDLHWGFHQIQMYANVRMQIESESERDITTFATDDRIFRYKRFGVNAAPQSINTSLPRLWQD